MKRYILTLALLCAFSGFALAQGKSQGTANPQSDTSSNPSISAPASTQPQDTMSGQSNENNPTVQNPQEEKKEDSYGHRRRHKEAEAGEQQNANPQAENQEREEREHQGAMTGQTGSMGAQSGTAATENPQEERRETPEQERREHQGATTGQMGTSEQNQGVAAGSSTQVQQQVQSALQSQLPSNNVNVLINNNNQVVLTGTVPSETDKNRAEQIAKQTVGANYTIVNQITTNNVNVFNSGAGATGGTTAGTAGAAAGTSGAPSGSTSSGAIASPAGSQTGAAGVTSESTLQSQIQQALQQQGLNDVQVNVNSGQIFLSGSVPTGKEKHMARQIAESNASGMRVVDKLTVTGRGHQR